MPTLTDLHTDRYQGVWASLPAYRNTSPGVEVLPVFLDAIGYDGWPEGWRRSVLDAGCGSGKGAAALHAAGFDVDLCDLTDEGLARDECPVLDRLSFSTACLWHPLAVQLPRMDYDFVYCCDVLEHLPPQFTMLAVREMLRIATRGVFLAVATQPDLAGAWVGVPLHETVQSFVWWRDSLREIGEVTDARDLMARATYLVRRRR